MYQSSRHELGRQDAELPIDHGSKLGLVRQDADLPMDQGSKLGLVRQDAGLPAHVTRMGFTNLLYS